MASSSTSSFRLSFLALFVLLTLVHALASLSLSYDGSECRGLVEFDLSSTSDVATLDGDVATDLSSFPVYIPYSCKAAFRRYYCLATYTPEAANTTSMCASVCQDVLDSCAVLLEEAAAASSFGLYLYDLFKTCVEDQTQTSCVKGSTDAYFSQDEPQCFYRTVVPDEHGASFPLEPSGCAIPCPGQVFHYIYPFWHKLLLALTIVSVVCACETSLSFAKKYWRQRNDRMSHGSGLRSLRGSSAFPVLMFCIGGLIQSLVTCIALIVELSQSKCEGNAKWRKATPMCYIQSITIYGSFMWSSCWSFIMAFETLSTVFWSLCPDPLKMNAIRAWYSPVSLAITIGTTMALHIISSQMVGFQLPFCGASSNSSSSIEPVVDAVFWIPAVVLVSASSVMMFVVIFRMLNLENRTERATIADQNTAVCWCFPSLFARSSKAYLLRILLLVLCYNWFTLFISSLLFNEQLHTSKYESNAIAYYSCLFTYSSTDPEVGREHCGSITEWNVFPSLWVFTFYVVIVGCFGLIPFLVFGADYECSSFQSSPQPGPAKLVKRLVIPLPLVWRLKASDSTPSPTQNRSAESPGLV